MGKKEKDVSQILTGQTGQTGPTGPTGHTGPVDYGVYNQSGINAMKLDKELRKLLDKARKEVFNKEESRVNRKMVSKKNCPKCGSSDINYSNEADTKSRGLLFKFVSLVLAVCTLGLSLIVTKNMRKVTTKNRVVGVCQKCGHKWNV